MKRGNVIRKKKGGVILKMRKICIIFIVILVCSNVHAQSVVVTGQGEERSDALRDAMRNAVEQVVGTLLSSQTLVQNAAVVQDEIFAKSQGFIQKYTVLKEYESGGIYFVQAKIDVNTEPDSKIVNKLQMLTMLNDPRIAVVIFSEEENQSYDMNSMGTSDITGKSDLISESAVIQRLIDSGFTRVVDASVTAKIRNSQFLNSILNNERQLTGEIEELGADYLILGKSTSEAANVVLPKWEKIQRTSETAMDVSSTGNQSEQVVSNLISGRANISLRIIKADTGAIIGVYDATGQGVDGSIAAAKKKALRQAGKTAGEFVLAQFSKQSGNIQSGVEILVNVDSMEQLQEIQKALKTIQGIQAVYLREFRNKKALIEIDSTRDLQLIFENLKDKLNLTILLDGISSNGIRITVM